MSVMQDCGTIYSQKSDRDSGGVKRPRRPDGGRKVPSALLNADALACRREISVDGLDQRRDLLAHDLVGHEDDDRDCRQNQRVLGHRLALGVLLVELAHLHICIRQCLHLSFLPPSVLVNGYCDLSAVNFVAGT
jgi:hypothetical protein